MEIVPKPKPKIPLSKKIVPLLSSLILISLVTSFLILSFFEKKLSSQQEELTKRLQALKTPEEEKLEKEIKIWEKRLHFLKPLLEEHLFFSRFFPFLESKIHKSVIIKSIKLEPQAGKVSFTAQTDNFQNLGKQLFLLKEDEKISDLNVSKISLTSDGKVQFDISFSFNKEFLK